jgi:hypothetical protein
MFTGPGIAVPACHWIATAAGLAVNCCTGGSVGEGGATKYAGLPGKGNEKPIPSTRIGTDANARKPVLPPNKAE